MKFTATFARIFRPLSILSFCFLGFAFIAQAQEAAAPKAPTISVHVQQHTFTLAPGGSGTFTLPNVKSPIRIEISNPTTNGGLQTPTEVMWALVNRDSGAGGGAVTWIGTSSDGSVIASNSFQATNIGNITCGPGCVIASLSVANASTGMLSLTQNPNTTAINGSYIVRVYF